MEQVEKVLTWIEQLPADLGFDVETLISQLETLVGLRGGEDAPP